MILTFAFDLNERERHAERKELILDKDFDEYFALMEEIQEDRRMVAKIILDLVDEHGCVMIEQAGVLRTHRYYVHPSLYEPGKYQYTSWDEYGPICHYNVSDSDGLGMELPRAAFTLSYKVA